MVNFQTHGIVVLQYYKVEICKYCLIQCAFLVEVQTDKIWRALSIF